MKKAVLLLILIPAMCMAQSVNTVVVSTVTASGPLLKVAGTVDGQAVTVNVAAASVDAQKDDAGKLKIEAQALQRRANFKPAPPAPAKTYPTGTVTLPAGKIENGK